MEIINIGNRIVNNYLVSTEQGYIAIDTGYSGNFSRYAKALAKRKILLADISYIFITHVHDDHVGFLAELIEATGAILIMHHESPERLLKGYNNDKGGCSSRLARLFVDSMVFAGIGKHEFPVVESLPATLLWDGKRQFFREAGIAIDILPLPGHTSDQIGLLTTDGKLFCGDAAMNGFPSLNRNIIWIEELGDYIRSWDTMIASDARMIYPSHGNPFSTSDLVRFRSSLNKLQLR